MIVLYAFRFRHRTGVVLDLEAQGATPCKANNAAFELLEARKREDSLPLDNDWTMVTRLPLREVV